MEGIIELGREAKKARVAQACAACRRRKTKCDGNQPCTPCHEMGLECSYDSQQRKSSLSYVRSLEQKISELERLMSLEKGRTSVSQSSEPSELETPDDVNSHLSSDVVETMFDAPFSTTEAEEHHDFGGLSLLNRLHTLCEHIRLSNQESHSSAYPANASQLSCAFDVAPPDSKPSLSWETFAILPSRDGIFSAVDAVVRISCCGIRFVDHETLHSITDDVLTSASHGSVSNCRKQLSLLFAVLALSQRLESDPVTTDNWRLRDGSQGNRYFLACRALLDPSDCQDLVSLSTLLCMIVYTQVSSMMSTCYSYICIAVAAVLQMGLLDQHHHQPSESEGRRGRELVTVLFIIDTYVTTALGLPRTLRDLNVDRIAVSKELFADAPETYAHARLAQILAGIMESNHPFTRQVPQSNGFYSVRYCDILEAEDRLTKWFDELPNSSSTAAGDEERSPLRCQLILRVYHAHVQMVLYRPFLHHALKHTQGADRPTIKAYACGSACIKAAMQVVWLVERMEANEVFNASHWFLTLIVAYAAACLVLFAIGAGDAPTTPEAQDAIMRLQGLCSRHGESSNSMNQCLTFLETYFPQGMASDSESTVNFQQRFEPNLSMFSRAFDQSYTSGLGDLGATSAPGDDVEALNLPNLHSFMHTSF